VSKQGKFIAVEGIDGAGKTTQAYMLVEKLRSLGYSAEYTTEPTYERIGTILRLHVAQAKNRKFVYEALLFAADRYEHLKKFILPRLKKGIHVVTDRYLYSSLAYQGVTGVSQKWLRDINFFAIKPDMTIYLDIDPARSLTRKKGHKTVFENLRNESRVRRIYLDLAKVEGFEVIDAGRDVQTVHDDIVACVMRLLKNQK
jgi:dTMP kinase